MYSDVGKKTFDLILFFSGLVFFFLSLKMWFHMEEPRLSSAAALPLFVSGIWTILMLSVLFENRKIIKVAKPSFVDAFKQLFPKEVLAIVAFVLVFCMSLSVLPFMVASGIFLYASMCYLKRKSYLGNFAWTALIMVFIFVVFELVFGVTLP